MTKLAILGCGPAGLLAKHAAVQAGVEARVYAANPRRSPMPGAQFLHASIPGITKALPDGIIHNAMIGENAGYRKKVYGTVPLPKSFLVSPESMPTQQPAWDLRAAYGLLWSLYGPGVFDTEEAIDAEWIEQEWDNFDFIVSTIPLPAICLRGHQFAGVKVNIVPDEFFGASWGEHHLDTGNVVVCNGEQNPSWYRTSRVFGHSHTEWPVDVEPPLPGRVEVTKPLFTQCDCYSTSKVIPAGRYGAWRKGILVHHVYEEVLGNLSSL